MAELPWAVPLCLCLPPLLTTLPFVSWLLVPSLSLFVAVSRLFDAALPLCFRLLPSFRLFVLVILCPLIALILFVVFLHAIHAEAYCKERTAYWMLEVRDKRSQPKQQC